MLKTGDNFSQAKRVGMMNYKRIKNDPSMNMQYGWYGDTNQWKTFNEWFSRHLIDPSVRPISDVEMLFQKNETGEGYKHILMGEGYMKLSK